MEKQVKKPDWTKVIAMADLSDYFKTAKSENDLNEIFDRELSKYKNKIQRDEIPEFIDIQIEKITVMVEKVKSVKDYAEFNEYRNAIFYLKYLQKKQSQVSDNKQSDESRNRTAIYAFYYHILHSVHPKTRFEHDPKGKMEAIKMLTQNKGISQKGFQMKYNELENKPETRISPKKVHILENVIVLLADNPEGLSLAKSYLESALKKR
jgi:hypothetical protein